MSAELMDDPLRQFKSQQPTTPEPTKAAHVEAYLKSGGGPAFPSAQPTGEGATMYSAGLSARDWFAGQALAGLCACQSTDHCVPTMLATASYALADAMLAARSKGGEK